MNDLNDNEIRAPIKAVIFDMDGLLLDSESLYTQITNEILAPYNKQLTWEIKSLIMGRPALESASILIERTGIPMKPEDLITAMFERQQLLFPSVQPMPGAIKLVNLLRERNIPIAIATGSIRRNFELKSMNLPRLFSAFEDQIICGDDPDLKRGKPSPDPFLLAAQRFLGLRDVRRDPITGFFEPPEQRIQGERDLSSLRTEEILVFEDGLPGVRSAKAAGMRVVWVPDPELRKLSLANKNNRNPLTQEFRLADQILNSLNDWDESDWNLLPPNK